jgi:hypothetical protein
VLVTIYPFISYIYIPVIIFSIFLRVYTYKSFRIPAMVRHVSLFANNLVTCKSVFFLEDSWRSKNWSPVVFCSRNNIQPNVMSHRFFPPLLKRRKKSNLFRLERSRQVMRILDVPSEFAALKKYRERGPVVVLLDPIRHKIILKGWARSYLLAAAAAAATVCREAITRDWRPSQHIAHTVKDVRISRATGHRNKKPR